MPSASASASMSSGYFLCSVRNGGAIASGLGVCRSMEWQRAQFVCANVRPRSSAGEAAIAGFVAALVIAKANRAKPRIRETGMGP